MSLISSHRMARLARWKNIVVAHVCNARTPDLPDCELRTATSCGSKWELRQRSQPKCFCPGALETFERDWGVRPPTGTGKATSDMKNDGERSRLLLVMEGVS